MSFPISTSKWRPGNMWLWSARREVGKTTLCSLIPRFYEVTEGRITLDGIDLREIKLKSLRKRSALSSRMSISFAGSVLENIKYGKPDATEEEGGGGGEKSQRP